VGTGVGGGGMGSACCPTDGGTVGSHVESCPAEGWAGGGSTASEVAWDLQQQQRGSFHQYFSIAYKQTDMRWDF
jgi:hypothetical protein